MIHVLRIYGKRLTAMNGLGQHAGLALPMIIGVLLGVCASFPVIGHMADGALGLLLSARSWGKRHMEEVQ